MCLGYSCPIIRLQPANQKASRRGRALAQDTLRLRSRGPTTDDIESRDSIGFRHGWEVEDVLNESIGGPSGNDSHLSHRNQLGRPFPNSLDPQDLLAFWVANQAQEATGIASDLATSELTKLGCAHDGRFAVRDQVPCSLWNT